MDTAQASTTEALKDLVAYIDRRRERDQAMGRPVHARHSRARPGPRRARGQPVNVACHLDDCPGVQVGTTCGRCGAHAQFEQGVPWINFYPARPRQPGLLERLRDGLRRRRRGERSAR
jgi:hypothetical protein